MGQRSFPARFINWMATQSLNLYTDQNWKTSQTSQIDFNSMSYQAWESLESTWNPGGIPWRLIEKVCIMLLLSTVWNQLPFKKKSLRVALMMRLFGPVDKETSGQIATLLPVNFFGAAKVTRIECFGGSIIKFRNCEKKSPSQNQEMFVWKESSPFS